MEFYCIHRKELTDSVKIARSVSVITGNTVLYHLVDCIYCIIRYGCGPSQYFEGDFYKLRSFERERTYTKYRGYKAKKIFNDSRFIHICTNKVDFNRFFSNYVKRNWIYCKDATDDELSAFLIANNKIMAKPNSQSKGKGVFVLDRSLPDDELVRLVVGKDIVLEQFLVQHPNMCFDNKSINTIRVNTILDSNGVAHIIKAALRCGVGDSVVDNYSAGGIVYPINVEYGRIEGPGIGKSNLYNKWLYVHPGSSVFMIGKQIPFWKELLEMVNNAAKSLPQVRLVGWDVAITNNGVELIEGNTRPGASVIENMGHERGFWKKMLSYR